VYTLSKKQGRVTVLLYTVLLVLLCACGGNSSGSGFIPVSTPAPYRPLIAVNICLDDTASYPPEFIQAIQHTLADRIDAMTQLNTGGMDVFVTVIAASSFQNDVIAFSVPAIPALPVKPVPGSDPYKYAKAMSDYKKAIPGALNQLKAMQAQVKVQTDKLRNLHFNGVAGGTDIFGCLADASQHFSHITGNKLLLIASDLQNNVTTQETNTLNLYGAPVRVVYRVCEVVSSCQANDAFWKQTFLHHGASSVRFYDPAESQAEKVSI